MRIGLDIRREDAVGDLQRWYYGPKGYVFISSPLLRLMEQLQNILIDKQFHCEILVHLQTNV